MPQESRERCWRRAEWVSGFYFLVYFLFCFTFILLLLFYEAHITNYKNFNHETILN